MAFFGSFVLWLPWLRNRPRKPQGKEKLGVLARARAEDHGVGSQGPLHLATRTSVARGL